MAGALRRCSVEGVDIVIKTSRTYHVPYRNICNGKQTSMAASKEHKAALVRKHASQRKVAYTGGGRTTGSLPTKLPSHKGGRSPPTSASGNRGLPARQRLAQQRRSELVSRPASADLETERHLQEIKRLIERKFCGAVTA